MRRHIADWSGAAVAILILVVGGLVVMKPAIDHWDDVYRADPFVVGTTTQTVSKRDRPKATRTTTKTTEDASSFVERLLGKSGTLLLRLGLVALVAFLAGAVLQRALLGTYTLRLGRRTPRASAPLSGGAAGPGPVASEEPTQVPLQNGHEGHDAHDGNDAAQPEPAPPNLAPGIAKLVSSRREALGLSQRELAKRAGISHTVISRIEGGDHSPSPKTLERLAEALR
jgi:DNA-binding XRE family transcriptional regulator